MKEEWKVYIKGVPNRGDDVVKELTNLGANNRVSYTGANPQCLYYIDHKGFVDYALLDNENGKIIMDNYSELHLTELWNNGDVLVSNNDTNRFYVFNCFANELSDNDAVGCGCLLISLLMLFTAIVIQNIILY